MSFQLLLENWPTFIATDAYLATGAYSLITSTYSLATDADFLATVTYLG